MCLWQRLCFFNRDLFNPPKRNRKLNLHKFATCLWLNISPTSIFFGLAHPFIDDFPIRTSISHGFSMAMLVITRGLAAANSKGCVSSLPAMAPMAPMARMVPVGRPDEGWPRRRNLQGQLGGEFSEKNWMTYAERIRKIGRMTSLVSRKQNKCCYFWLDRETCLEIW